jgi:hypothetical protein
MINPFKDVDWNPDTAALRAFARSLLIGFPIIALAAALIGWGREEQIGRWPWILGMSGAAAAGLFWLLPALAKPFYLIWFFAACCVGIIVSNLALAAVFYLIFTPVGLAFRVVRRDALRRRLNPLANTYWQEAESAGNDANPDSYYRQF